MIPQWLLFAALAGLGSNLFNFLNRFFLKDEEDSTAYAWFYEFIRACVFGAIAIFDWHVQTNFKAISILLLLGSIEFISVFATMKMHYHSHLSVSSIISRLRTLWVPIIGFIILNEKLHLTEYVGIFILFVGTSIVASPSKIIADKGIKYANIAAFVNAVTVVYFKEALSLASNSIILFTSTLPSLIIYPFLMKSGFKRIINSFHKKFWIKTIAAISAVLSGYFILFALKIGDASKVNAIYQGMIVINVIAGIFILKEKENIGRKLLGTIITIIGVLLLS